LIQKSWREHLETQKNTQVALWAAEGGEKRTKKGERKSQSPVNLESHYWVTTTRVGRKSDWYDMIEYQLAKPNLMAAK